MEFLRSLIDIALNLDTYIGTIIMQFGALAYLVLFLIIFLETGIIITPFLPGDSLIFIAGAFAAQGFINVFLLFFVLASAAILGDTINYWIGSYFGENVFQKSRFFKKEYLERTKRFYEKHGGKTIVFARFIPIIRTFAPFVAGVGKMNYMRFLSFNVVGGIIWVAIFVFGGYYLGQIPLIRKNLTIFVLFIILLSAIPLFVEYIKRRARE